MPDGPLTSSSGTWAGTRHRVPAGLTVSQALEAQHINDWREARSDGVASSGATAASHTSEPEPTRLSSLDPKRYLDQIDTLKNRNTLPQV